MKTIEEVMNCLNRQVCICDSTLTEGEQAAGVVFSNIEKYRLAQLLDEAHVPQIEVGIPVLGGEEKKAVKHIANMGLDASIATWNIADQGYIDASIDCCADAVRISLPVSDRLIEKRLRKPRNDVFEILGNVVDYAKKHGLYVICNAEDAPHADMGFLLDFIKVATQVGADRIAYCDTVGVENPFTCYEKIKTLKQFVKFDLEIVARNDFGLATANCLAGIKAGARFANTTATGLGKGAGCAPLEQVAMAAKHILDLDTGIDTRRFNSIAEAVSLAAGRGIPEDKPIIGSGIFAQEAGVRMNGAVADENGEAFDPAEVDSVRTMVIGKHSGRNTIVSELAEMNIQLSKEEASCLLDMVRKASMQMHRSLSPRELYLLYQDMNTGADVFDENTPDTV